MGLPKQIAYNKAAYEYDNQVPDNTYKPGLEDETAEQIFDRLPEQGKSIFLWDLGKRVNPGRAFRVLTEELADQTTINITESFLEALKKGMLEELEYPQSRVDRMFSYNCLRTLLTDIHFFYKRNLENYLEGYHFSSPELNRELSDWHDGKVRAYRKAIREIIKLMRNYKEYHGTNN